MPGLCPACRQQAWPGPALSAQHEAGLANLGGMASVTVIALVGSSLQRALR